MNNENLNKIWHIDMQLDTTEKDKQNGLDGTIKFTKIGLIDWLLTDEITKDFFNESELNYEITDDDLIKLLREYCYDWEVLSIE